MFLAPGRCRQPTWVSVLFGYCTLLLWLGIIIKYRKSFFQGLYFKISNYGTSFEITPYLQNHDDDVFTWLKW